MLTWVLAQAFSKKSSHPPKGSISGFSLLLQGFMEVIIDDCGLLFSEYVEGIEKVGGHPRAESTPSALAREPLALYSAHQ